MATETFYVKVETAKMASVFAFSRSETGILDYAGTATPSADDLSQMQCVDGSAYFTPSWYTYLPNALHAEITVFIPADVQNLDANQYSFLLHIGAILLAVQERDSLLVAELLHRRSMVFANFIPILLHLLRPVAAEALFAWVTVVSIAKAVSRGCTQAINPFLLAKRIRRLYFMLLHAMSCNRNLSRNLLKKCSSAILARIVALILPWGLSAHRTIRGWMGSKSSRFFPMPQ